MVNTYGDDAYLDGLWDDCAAGDMTACDALYQESPIGSEYETFGDTCGYLTSGGTWCVEIDPGHRRAPPVATRPSTARLRRLRRRGLGRPATTCTSQSPVGLRL